jgi:hypothetical protein
VVAICLAIASAITVNDPSASARVVRWSAFITFAAAVLVIGVAQYDAWKEEYLTRKNAEFELNKEADMRGSIMVSLADRPMLISTAVGAPAHPALTLRFRFDCANYGRKPVQISRLLVDIRKRDTNELISSETITLPQPQTIAHGERFYGASELPFVHIPREELEQMYIAAGLVDSLDTIYRDNITTTMMYVPASSTEVL